MATRAGPPDGGVGRRTVSLQRGLLTGGSGDGRGDCWVGRMDRHLRVCRHVGLAVPDELGVRSCAHQLGQLRGVGHVDRVAGDVGPGVARAVPVEVMPARSPATPVVLRDGHFRIAGAIGSFDVPKGSTHR